MILLYRSFDNDVLSNNLPFMYYISDLELHMFKQYGMSKITIIDKLVGETVDVLYKLSLFKEDVERRGLFFCFLGNYGHSLKDAKEFFYSYDSKLKNKLKQQFNDFDFKFFVKNLNIIILSGNKDHLGIDCDLNDLDKNVYNVFNSPVGKTFKTYYLNDKGLEFDNVILVGGTGWYKNNSDKQNVPQCYSLSYEKYHADKLNKSLNLCVDLAKSKNKQLICLSHNPLQDWIYPNFNFDDLPILFINGHSISTDIKLINKCIQFPPRMPLSDDMLTLDSYYFQSVKLSSVMNPYDYLNDYRLTNLNEMSMFYNYKDMDISLQNYRNLDISDIYVMKYKDYYGFIGYHPRYYKYFILSGGMFKKSNLLEVTSIKDAYRWFKKVIDVIDDYLLSDSNNTVSYLYEALKLLGFTAKKHDNIIDLSNDYHIIVDSVSKEALIYRKSGDKLYVSNDMDEGFRNLIVANLGMNCGSVFLDSKSFEMFLYVMDNLTDDVDLFIYDDDYIIDENSSGYYLDLDILDDGRFKNLNSLRKMFNNNILFDNIDVSIFR